MLSDTHIRSTIPVGRIDNFLETQYNKWLFIKKTIWDENVDLILQAGDLFDRPSPPLSLISKYGVLFQEMDIPIYCVLGQHDMLMRSKVLNRTAIGLFQMFGLIKILNLKGIFISGIHFFGNSYNDNYNEIKGISKIDFNILVTHDMIGNKPLYPGHKITKAKAFLQTYKEFDIILCGDYHYPFFEKSSDVRVILNTGCLLRMTRLEDDMNRRPHFYIYDTEKNKWQKFYIPCEPAEIVFSMKEEQEQKTSVVLEEFIEKLKRKEKIGLSYMDNLEEYFKENKTSEPVKKLIEEVLS